MEIMYEMKKGVLHEECDFGFLQICYVRDLGFGRKSWKLGIKNMKTTQIGPSTFNLICINSLPTLKPISYIDP